MKKILSITLAGTFAALTLTQAASAARFSDNILSSLSDKISCSDNGCTLGTGALASLCGSCNTLTSEKLLDLLKEGNFLPQSVDLEKLVEALKNCGGTSGIGSILDKFCDVFPCLPGQNGTPETEKPENPAPETPEVEIPDEKPEQENPDVNVPETEKPEEAPDVNLPEIEIPDINIPDTEKPDDGNNGGGSTQTPPVTDKYSAYASEVVALVNKERAANGLSQLSASDTALTAAANVRAKEQAQLFSHTRPNGQEWSTVLREYGISYMGAGENVAYGQKTPGEVVNAWMNSPGHRANILGNYTEIGVGVYYANGTYYWAQLFTR